MGQDRKKNIKELEILAKEVLELKQKVIQKKPLLIEFCGSPKSGKSTTINALNIFLKRNDFKTVVLTERAGICPIRNKRNPSFNIWTLTSAVAEILVYLDEKVDVIIADRGIFDALCWFEWLNTNPPENPHLDKKNFEDLKRFILMDLWKESIDLIYVFKVKPKISIEREFATLLTDKTGSIMNVTVLEGFNVAIDTIRKTYKKHFKEIQYIETDTEETNKNPNNVSSLVTKNILEKLKELLTEKIGVIKPELIQTLENGKNDFKIIQDELITYLRRDLLESEDSKQIQLVPIAVITNPELTKVLVVKKNPKANSGQASPEKDKLLLYIGGHVRDEDAKDTNSNLAILKSTLHREILEEIGESIYVNSTNEPFLIYNNEHARSAKHLAVCFIIKMNLDEKSFKLTSDEFVMKSGTSKSGHVILTKDFMENSYDLEPWSKTILKEVFKIVLKSNQKSLFGE